MYNECYSWLIIAYFCYTMCYDMALYLNTRLSVCLLKTCGTDHWFITLYLFIAFSNTI